MPIANGLGSERPVGARFLLLLVELGVAPAVSVPLERAVADGESEDDEGESEDDEGESEDDEGDNLGHKLSYTNC